MARRWQRLDGLEKALRKNGAYEGDAVYHYFLALMTALAQQKQEG